MHGRRPRDVGEGTVILMVILVAGAIGGNQLVSVSAAVMVLLQATGRGDVLRLLEKHGIDLGLIFLLLGLLLPFATGELG